MSRESMPETSTIREGYVRLMAEVGRVSGRPQPADVYYAEFDRWLTQCEAELREQVANELLIERDRARSAHRSARVDHFAHDYCRWVGHAEALTQAAAHIARGKDQA